MKQAKIYYKDILAGVLTESDDGYEFRYLPEYLASENAKPVKACQPDTSFAKPAIPEQCPVPFL